MRVGLGLPSLRMRVVGHLPRFVPLAILVTCAAALGAISQPPAAQGGRSWRELATSGLVTDIRFDEVGGGVFYRKGSEWLRMPLVGGEAQIVEESAVPAAAPARDPSRALAPSRGRQRAAETSPDGAWTARSADGDITLGRENAADRQVTIDGKGGVKYGTASWVYGEELDQSTAMWWSPDSTLLAFYRFDESAVPPYYMLSDNIKLRPAIERECYPKPGDPNPVAGLRVYDVNTRVTHEVDTGTMVGDGSGGRSPALAGDANAAADSSASSAENAAGGSAESSDARVEYVYNIRFSPGGRELLFNRTNRWQDTLELCAWDVATRTTRVILSETQGCWHENNPQVQFLADGRHFIWSTENSGFRHYELHSLDTPEVVTLTKGEFPCNKIVKLDEARGTLWFSANSGEMPLNAQYHRVMLDGSQQTCVTPANRYHSRLTISPSGEYFTCSDETIDEPPTTRLYKADGSEVALLAQSERDPWTAAGVPKPLLVKCKAADGETDLYAIAWRPAGFDPAKRYPMVVHVYGGPLSTAFTGQFASPDEKCDRGFVTMRAENRGTQGRGKTFETGAYLKLGVVDLDDQAAAARQVAEACSVDPKRIGIIGSSYGGYLSALAVIRHPDVFRAAVAESAVTDWKNYDTIYTERFMRTPQANPEGYKAGSCVEHAEDLGGALLLVHGLGDDNVHPQNLWQLANELQGLSKAFQMMVFPEAGHGIWGPYCENLEWGFLATELEASPVP